MRLSLTIATLALILLSSGSRVRAEPGALRPGERELPQVSASIEFEGGLVPYQYRMFISPARGAAGPSATRLRILLDLSGAFSSLGESLQQRLPDERCGGYKADNWVVRLRELSAETDDDELLLGLIADVQLWACVDLKFLGDASTELGDARVWVELPLALQAQPQRVSLRSRRLRVDADGDLARAARLYFASRGEDLSAVLAERVERIESRELKFDLPALLIANGAHIAGARFVSIGGMPHAEIEIIASIGIGTWMDLLRRLWLGGI